MLPKITSNEVMDKLNQEWLMNKPMEKLQTRKPESLFSKILGKQKIEKVKVNEPEPIKTSNISTLDYFKLWLVSWFRNKAKAELQGKHSPLPFDLTGGFPVKGAIAFIGAVVALVAVSC